MPPSEVYTTFQGIDRKGVSAIGSVTDEVGPFVDARFRAGWRSLQVERAGEQVGGITVRDGRRVWWAENAR